MYHSFKFVVFLLASLLMCKFLHENKHINEVILSHDFQHIFESCEDFSFATLANLNLIDGNCRKLLLERSCLCWNVLPHVVERIIQKDN